MSLECDAQGEYAPKDADGKPLFPVCMQRGAIQQDIETPLKIALTAWNKTHPRYSL